MQPFSDSANKHSSVTKGTPPTGCFHGWPPVMPYSSRQISVMQPPVPTGLSTDGMHGAVWWLQQCQHPNICTSTSSTNMMARPHSTRDTAGMHGAVWWLWYAPTVPAPNTRTSTSSTNIKAITMPRPYIRGFMNPRCSDPLTTAHFCILPTKLLVKVKVRAWILQASLESTIHQKSSLKSNLKRIYLSPIEGIQTTPGGSHA